MRQIIILFFISISVLNLKSQPSLVKSWDYRYGGNGDEAPRSLIETLDHGFLLCSSSNTQAINFDKSEIGRGGGDLWIIKTDSNGIKIWDKTLGGSDYDYIKCGIALPDSGFLIGGISKSGISGDKTQPNNDPVTNTNDYWIIRLDKNGNIVWDKTFGGTDEDVLSTMILTSDGNYLLGGITYSDSTVDMTHHNFGNCDYWVLKIDNNGNKIWDKNFGGLLTDKLNAICMTSDHGFVLAGHSNSPANASKSQPNINSYNDYWILKIDSNGTQQWDKTYGGDGYDFLYSVIALPGDQIFICGTSNSGVGYDKTVPNHGSSTDYDFWVLKINGSGNKIWDKVYGGTGVEDDLNTATPADGGVLLSGTSYSNISGDKSEDNIFSQEQTWAIAIDTLGNKMWDKTINTTTHVELGFGLQTHEGCYVFSTHVNSGGGDVTVNRNSNYDSWIVKYCASNAAQADFTSSATTICQNSCLSFTNHSLNASSYSWTFPGGTPSTSTAFNPQGICYFNSGTFDVILVASNGFSSDTLVLPNFVTIYPQIPFAPLTQYGDTLFSVPGYTSYVWYFNGVLIGGANNYYYVVHQNGNYGVVVTDSNGCNAAAQLINVISATNEIQSTGGKLKIQISSDNISLDINSSSSAASIIALSDVQGKIIYNKNTLLQKGNNLITIPKENISTGIYFVKILNAKECLSDKIFIR